VLIYLSQRGRLEDGLVAHDLVPSPLTCRPEFYVSQGGNTIDGAR
jgi:hypothetical protein